MTLDILLQPLVYGLQIGLTYVLLALGLTVIFSIMNVLNLAHGEFYMLGAFTVFYINGLLKVNYFLALIMSVVVVAVIGIFFERIFFRPARGDVVPTVIVGIGLMWLLQTAAQLLFGAQPRGMKEVFQGSVSFLNMNISDSRIAAGIISILLVSVVYLFIYKTKQGKAMQAVAQDREAAMSLGIDVGKIGTLGFALGCGLAGAAGGLMAPIFFIEPTMGTTTLIKSLCIIILGGVGSIPGAALGGIILGIIESYGQTFLGYSATTFPFLIILFILVFKRTGLMGRAA
ncbi:MAG: inner-rane translocator [Deltaproteobacteria bacterium]|jgi:branched-chain amino acid transport system permease protein|nr:inner-rane translocator [Deltaproteobacteria bacterium]